MKRNIFTIAALVACTAFGVAQAQVSDGIVKIGVLNDMSGLYSDITGQGPVRVAKMAAVDYVKVTKNPLKVEIVGADHQNKSDVGSNIARQWFDTDKVDMIADALTSSVGLAIAQIAKDKCKLHANSSSATVDLTGKSCKADRIQRVL
jgi:branched-chain amino acid transport system substrate-binding protein